MCIWFLMILSIWFFRQYNLLTCTNNAFMTFIEFILMTYRNWKLTFDVVVFKHYKTKVVFCWPISLQRPFLHRESGRKFSYLVTNTEYHCPNQAKIFVQNFNINEDNVTMRKKGDFCSYWTWIHCKMCLKDTVFLSSTPYAL